MRWSALFPLACAIAGFTLSMLCLFAGSKPGFMEEYHIVTLNTSELGQNIIPTSTTSSGSTPTSLGSFFSSLAKNITSAVEGELEGIADEVEGDVADKLSKALGIHQWYSWHILDLCEGNYAPNATAKGASYNTTSCSNRTAMYHFNFENILNSELESGPLHINLSFIDWPADVQKTLNDVSAAVDALFVVYVIGIAAAGLCIITSIIALFLHGSRITSMGNWSLAILSFFCLLVASIIVTVAQEKIVHIVNDVGKDIGVHAHKGLKYLALTWSAMAVMFVGSISWCAEFAVGKRNKGREYTEKKTGARAWWGGRRGSDENALRRSGV